MASGASDQPHDDTFPQAFDQRRSLLFALAGTVPLPSPVPATARVFLGILPGERDANTPGLPPRYLKLTQRLSPNLLISRIVNLSDVRAVELPDSAEISQPASSQQQSKDKETSAVLDQQEAQVSDQVQRPQQPPKPPRRNRYLIDDSYVKSLLITATGKLEAKREAGGSTNEELLFEGAVIFVPETAPVLLCEVHEFGVTAAVASQRSRIVQDPCSPCLIPKPKDDES